MNISMGSMQVFPYNIKEMPSPMSTRVVKNGQSFVNVVIERPLTTSFCPNYQLS